MTSTSFRSAIAVAAAAALSLPCFAGTAEEEEAARIQINTGGGVVRQESLVLLPAAKDAKPSVSPWLGCEAFLGPDGAVSFKAGKDWAGFRLNAPAASTSISLNSALDFEDVNIFLKMKFDEGASPGNLQVALVGKDAEGKASSSAYLSLAGVKVVEKDAFSELALPLRGFRSIDKLKSLSGLCVQFVQSPPAARISLVAAKIERSASKSARTKFKVEKVDLASLAPSAEKFPAGATNIRIVGPDIVRDGSPVFLTGVEDDAIDFPWLYKLLRFDVVQLQDFAASQQMRCKLKGDDLDVSWAPMNDWIETKVRSLLRDGFALHINYWDGEPTGGKDVKVRFERAMADASHFYTWRLDDPVGRAIKEEYTKATLRTLGKYPVLFYELYNEIYYGDTSPAALAAFQKEVEAKYGSIEAANKAWNTSFSSFEAIIPPRKKVKWAAYKSLVEPQPVPLELYAEWQRFVERHLGAELRKLTASVKRELKHPGSYVIYQAVMNLSQDFSGFTNTYPKELLSAEDALCHEGGMSFYPQEEGRESVRDIAKMCRPLMVWDLLKGISPDKPVYLSECGVNAVSPSFDKGAVVRDFAGEWRFADAKAVGPGWEKPSFDDSAWAKVKVPGVWGSQGFPKCVKGLYRLKFDAPAKTAKIFLTGKELADNASVYLNGELLRETESWGEGFSVDVSSKLLPKDNVVALSIANSYEVAGQVQGGVRDFICLSDKPFFGSPKLTAGQMRSWFWSMAMHDVSGVIMSYFYTSATSKLLPIYSQVTKDYAAVRAIPEAKGEIDSVAKPLLPRPRLKGELAIVYPFENGRARLSESNGDLYTGVQTLDMMEYYLSALFSQFTPEVTTCDALQGGAASAFKAVVLPSSSRVLGGVPAQLERFVANGGVLVLGPGAMSFDDDAHASIPTPGWFGVKVGKPLLAAKTFDGRPVSKREVDGSYGVEISLAGAEAFAKFSDGTTAVAVNKHGKGFVYYFACAPDFKSLKSRLSSIFAKHGLKRSLELSPLDGRPADFVEAHLAGSKERRVLYLNNFGGGARKLKVAWPDAPAGSFSLRNVADGSSLFKSISSEGLRKGVEIMVGSQAPSVLLLEPVGVDALALAPLPAAVRRSLEMWRPSPKGEVKVLFESSTRAEMDPFRMLTAKRLLEERGFQFDCAMGLPASGKIEVYEEGKALRPLSDFDIFVMPGSRVPKNEKSIQEVVEYVRNGGSLLLSATANFGYFGWMSNVHNRKALFEAFGLKCSDFNFRDEKANDGFSPYFCEFSNVKQGHPVVKGVGKVQIAGASVIDAGKHEGDVLIRSNASSSPAGRPFLLAFEFGKGRVVAMGDASWLSPEWLVKADNAQLMLNVFNWLARKDCDSIREDEIAKFVETKTGE